MSANEVVVKVSAPVDVEDFAAALAEQSSEDQGVFFNEFFRALDSGCTDRPNGVHWQLDYIVREMNPMARALLEKMAEISTSGIKEAAGEQAEEGDRGDQVNADARISELPRLR